ncbi:MerR family transcriptional regulator [uncultured Brachybacterium sp.]|uniref:MerR family transcriptional regulator n=1 Tax=uncultured Brachybacterium sp. TaxID=189680 RepID=UPI002625C1EC|nr:MerR family transcriptional regulator [uncultured Brachybacterium sp.]
MLLAELAEVSGVSVASIKFYRREGLLPAGARLTATRQDYGTAHLERLELIQVLREVAGAPIARIAHLTAILDDPEQPLLSALGAAQLISLGLPAEEPDTAGAGLPEHPSIAPLLSHLGWPDVHTAPRSALDTLLRSLEGWGMPTDDEVLRRFAEPVAEIARADVASIRDLRGELPDGPDGSPVSDDVQVMRAVAGAIAFDRLIQLLRALGHTSYSILQARDPG